jgi:hypothetical protein
VFVSTVYDDLREAASDESVWADLFAQGQAVWIRGRDDALWLRVYGDDGRLTGGINAKVLAERPFPGGQEPDYRDWPR